MLTVEQIQDKMKDRRVAQIARTIGVSRQAIYDILKGRSLPTYEMLRKLSEYLEGNK